MFQCNGIQVTEETVSPGICMGRDINAIAISSFKSRCIRFLSNTGFTLQCMQKRFNATWTTMYKNSWPWFTVKSGVGWKCDRQPAQDQHARTNFSTSTLDADSFPISNLIIGLEFFEITASKRVHIIDGIASGHHGRFSVVCCQNSLQHLCIWETTICD